MHQHGRKFEGKKAEPLMLRGELEMKRRRERKRRRGTLKAGKVVVRVRAGRMGSLMVGMVRGSEQRRWCRSN